MKKKLFIPLFILISGIASAQFTIWEDDFDDADISDWTLIDADGDAVNWISRNNIQVDENGAIVGGTYNILGTYNIDMATGAPLGVLQENWAITPAVDLSFYSGGMQLILNAQKAIFDSSDNLYIYASTTNTAPGSFTLISTLELKRETQLDDLFKDYIVDISQFAGQSQVYFAFLNAPGFVVGYEIDKVSITAASLGLDDIKNGKTTILKQNPVEDYLQLQLNSKLNEEEVTLKIYNTTGILVKETKYNESGILISNLSSGLYFLVVEEGNKTEKIKFIKK